LLLCALAHALIPGELRGGGTDERETPASLVLALVVKETTPVLAETEGSAGAWLAVRVQLAPLDDHFVCEQTLRFLQGGQLPRTMVLIVGSGESDSQQASDGERLEKLHLF
ncbi:hypothetical protein PFISCL1PPCAC_17878, partial [Pristionchus fissidentatus]